jgi:hypothetical protein
VYQAGLEFVCTARVINMRMSDHHGQRLLEEISGRLVQVANTHAGVYQKVGFATPDVPDIAAQKTVYVRFREERDLIIHSLLNKPLIGNG